MVITIGGSPLPVLPCSILYLIKLPAGTVAAPPVLCLGTRGRSAHVCPLNHSASTATCQPNINQLYYTRPNPQLLRLYTGERTKTASGPAVTTSGSVVHNIRIICWCCRENIYLLTYLLTQGHKNTDIPLILKFWRLFFFVWKKSFEIPDYMFCTQKKITWTFKSPVH